MSDDKGVRRTMEDAYSYIVDFAGIRGQGFFAIFDGHAGKHAAEWCGQHFHEVRRRTTNIPSQPCIPALAVNARLERMGVQTLR